MNGYSLFNDTLLSQVANTAPRYNLIKVDEGTLIEVLVPGRTKEDIEVTIDEQRLLIRCTKLPDPEYGTYVHKGLSSKGFELPFILSRASEVKNVRLDNGILKILVSSKLSVVPKVLEIT